MDTKEAYSLINSQRNLGIYIPPEIAVKIQRHFPDFVPDPNIKPLSERMAEKGAGTVAEYVNCN